MDPVTGAATTINKAAEFGAAIFMAVIAIGVLAYLVVNFSKQAARREAEAARREERMDQIVANNTMALAEHGPILARICEDLGAHDRRTHEAVVEIGKMAPIVHRIDDRTASMEKFFG